MSQPSIPPPQYTGDTTQPLLVPGDGAPARTENDNLPDDFKYSTSVAEAEIDIRHAFVRKVYTILSVQLLLTGAVGALITLNSSVSQWALNNQWAMWVSMFGAIGLMIGAFVTQRTYPTNLIFLGLFTLFESYAIGVVSSLYDTQIVVQAVLITLVVFVGLTLFSMQTKYDFTSWQMYLGAGLWALIGVGFIAMFFPMSSTVTLGYSIVGALIFSGYILVDTQLIMHRYHPEDEVAAAISLYLDILNLFLNILRILNQVQRD